MVVDKIHNAGYSQWVTCVFFERKGWKVEMVKHQCEHFNNIEEMRNFVEMWEKDGYEVSHLQIYVIPAYGDGKTPAKSPAKVRGVVIMKKEY